jgi:hypothetical protein
VGYRIEEKDIIYQVSIDDYIEHVVLSNKRRPVYYNKTDKIPKKYQNNKYHFDKLGNLIMTETNEKILKNIRSVGKPRYKKISGQNIWVGLNHNLRNKIAYEIKKFFYKHLKDLKVIPKQLFPLGVDIKFVKPIGNNNWDLDNLALIYRKVLLDCLKTIIGADDSIEFIREIPTRYSPSSDESRKLIITIYTITDE